MKNIDKQIEDTLKSIEGISQAEPKPFFYTRLKARMESELNVSVNRVSRLKPALLIPMLACSLLLSVVSIYTVINYDSDDSSLTSQEAFIQEHGLNDYGSVSIY